jgi:hypothetical protein
LPLNLRCSPPHDSIPAIAISKKCTYNLFRVWTAFGVTCHDMKRHEDGEKEAVMFNKAACTGFMILMFFHFAGRVYGKGEIEGYLQVIYKSCECGMNEPHVFSCYAPFSIKGKRIIGTFEIAEDEKAHLPLVPIVPAARDSSEFEKQVIKYSFQCPAIDEECPPTDVNGQLVVHKVSGEVLKVKGKKMLHFLIRLSIPFCIVNVCGYTDDRAMEPWSDEFLAPCQDGFHTERGENALLSYALNLQAGDE